MLVIIIISSFYLYIQLKNMHRASVGFFTYIQEFPGELLD